MTTRSRASRLVPLALVLCAAGAPACAKKANKAELPAKAESVLPSVRIVKPTTKLDVGSGKVTGAIRSRNEAVLSSKLTAQIIKLDVNVGDKVQKGQVIAQLDATNATIQLENTKAAERLAAANVASAKLELDRSQALSATGAVAPAMLDRAKTAYELAQAQLDQARAAGRSVQQTIADAVIRAPFAGVVAAKHKNLGDTVAAVPPTAIVTIVDPDKLEVRLALPEALAAFAPPGELLRGALSPSGAPFEAKVRVVGAIVDTASRTIEVIADLVNKDNPGFRPGALVTVDFGQRDTGSALYLPTAAVRRDGDKAYVLVVEGEQVKRREVVAVPLNPGTVQVQSGVTEKDAVAMDQSGTLRAGDRVAILAD